MNEKPTYTISDLAKHFDLTPRTIRFYIAQKLLKAPSIEPSAWS